MPAADSRFSEEYLDDAVEAMRAVLRDLRKVHDTQTALQVREAARGRLIDAARVFKELRDEYDQLIDEALRMREELAESRQWDRRYRLLQGSIEDVIRGIVDLEELRALARDYARRNMRDLDMIEGAT